MAQTTFDPTPLYAVVGATDLAVEQLRSVVTRSAEVQAQLEARLAKLQGDLEKALGQSQKAMTEFDPKKASTQLSALPNAAAAKVLAMAGKYTTEAEETYGSFAQRGRSLVDRLQSQKTAQDLLDQGRTTIARGRGAVTSARKAADATVDAVLETVTTGKRSAEDVVEVTTVPARPAARAGAKKTTATARKTASTARAKAGTAETQARTTRTSAKKTVTTARKATATSAKKVGTPNATAPKATAPKATAPKAAAPKAAAPKAAADSAEKAGD